MYDFQDKDPRIVESRNQIVEGMLRLLEKERFAEVTITQICQEARISRATFYRNFETKSDVIRYILVRDIEQYQSQGYVPRDLRDSMIDFFRNMPYSRRLLKIIQQNQLFSMFEDIYVYWKRIYETAGVAIFPKGTGYDDYQEEYLKSVTIGLLKVWTERAFQETPDELADLLCHMIHQ